MELVCPLAVGASLLVSHNFGDLCNHESISLPPSPSHFPCLSLSLSTQAMRLVLPVMRRGHGLRRLKAVLAFCPRFLVTSTLLL